MKKLKQAANNVDNVQCLHKVGTVISTHVVLNKIKSKKQLYRQIQNLCTK